MIEAKLYATLRALADGNKSVEIEGGSTVGAALDQLVTCYPKLRDGLFDDRGAVRGFVAVMVNGRDIRHLDGLDSLIEDGATLDIFPPVAGGAIVA
jgi:molybdopterin synthase sulfur carrier subunit